MASSHDPATCPCNKCSARRSEERTAAAVAAASGQAQAMTGQAPEARVVQEIVPADKLAEALERIYFDGNYVLSTVPAGIYVDERAMRASASLGAVMTFTEFRVIYIKGKFL